MEKTNINNTAPAPGLSAFLKPQTMDEIMNAVYTPIKKEDKKLEIKEDSSSSSGSWTSSSGSSSNSNSSSSSSNKGTPKRVDKEKAKRIMMLL